MCIRDRLRDADRLGGQVLDLLDPLHRGEPLLQLHAALDQLPDRRHQVEQVEQERDQRRHLQRAGGDPRAADAQHGQERDLHRHPRRHSRQRRPSGDLQPPVAGPHGRVADHGDLPLLRAAGLDGPVRLQRPVQHRAHLAHGLLGLGLRPLDPRHDQRHHAADHHHHEQRHEQQHAVHGRHQGDGPHQHERRADRVDDAVGQHGPQQGRVTGHPRQQVAGLEPVHVRDLEPQHPVHQVPAGAEHDALARAFHQVTSPGRDDRPDEHRRGQPE